MDGRALCDAALKALHIDRFVIGIHDPAFPALPHEEVGRGTPYSDGAQRLLAFAAALGFNGVQLGPQGMTHAGSASPYEATLFSRNPLNLPLPALVEDGALSSALFDELRGGAPRGDRVAYAQVFQRFERVTGELRRRHRADPSRYGGPVRAFLARERRWLEPDALYAALCREHRQAWWMDWPQSGEQGAFDQRLFAPKPGEERRASDRLAQLRARYAAELEDYALVQWLLHLAHEQLRERARTLGLRLYGDLQIGYSAQDGWAQRALFLEEYRMGAPPSRTNPEGQPWGYPVLDPRRFGTPEAPGPVLDFVRLRMGRMLREYDGVRIDHPHGWICPWVYRAEDPDPLHAVQHGSRLRSSPDEPDHPLLRDLAIARPEQLDRGQPRHADGRVRELSPAQVDGYAVLVDELVEQARARGLRSRELVCEILSTLPFPVAKVLERHGLGRFRVTQKARLDLPDDVYRSENAHPEDWIMLGNHDTPPIWRVVDGWRASGQLEGRARYLAERLEPEPAARTGFAQRLVADPNLLVQAQLADALRSPARNVYVFFTDLLGLRDVYNAPGTISELNWSLRLGPDFADDYARKRARREALDVPFALALALRAVPTHDRLELAAALDRHAAGRQP